MPHRWLEHTSEVELQIEAGDEESVFEQALRALAELVADEPVDADDAAVSSHRVTAQAPDRAALLVAWLDELVYLVESEGAIPLGVQGLRLADGRVEALVAARHGRPRQIVKAVTYNDLAYVVAPGKVTATVVLDV